jgi:hypothetical protein
MRIADPIEEAGPEPPPCQLNYAHAPLRHPRYPSGNCVVCGARCTDGCKYHFAVGEYAEIEP